MNKDQTKELETDYQAWLENLSSLADDPDTMLVSESELCELTEIFDKATAHNAELIAVVQRALGGVDFLITSGLVLGDDRARLKDLAQELDILLSQSPAQSLTALKNKTIQECLKEVEKIESFGLSGGTYKQRATLALKALIQKEGT